MRDVNTWLKRWYCTRIVTHICIEIDYLASSSSCNVIFYWSCGIFFLFFKLSYIITKLWIVAWNFLLWIYCMFEKVRQDIMQLDTPLEWSRGELWIVILNSKAIINHSDRFDGYRIIFENLIYCVHYKVVPSIWTVDFGWNLI